MYESTGWPPLVARHYRERRCGRHMHCVITAAGHTCHVDQRNPDCSGELVPHLVRDFWPAHRDWLGPVLAIGGLTALALAIAGGR